MSEEPERLTREQWRQRVMKEGRDDVIRREMIRLGFWTDKPIPKAEQAQIEQEEAELKQLRTELSELRRESAKLGDMDQLIKEARQKRIEESRRRRARKKIERERQQKDAKLKWKEYQTTHVIHAGKGVSWDLQSTTSDDVQLKEKQLPLLPNAQDLANELGISMSKLKWLTYHRGTATLCHYTQFTVPKKNGGTREISAPKPDLRKAQSWIKTNILDQIPVHELAYGFVTGKNTVDNAKQHLQKAAVVKMDLKDFFPTITFRRVKGLFRSFGYSGQVSTLLALLCTEPPRKQVKFDGKYYYVAIGERQLPQGACTSPGITNLICRRLDDLLNQLASVHDFTYTRYADDLTFSCNKHGLGQIGRLIHDTKNIVRFEGFYINEEKTRILRSAGRQKVTGIVVNEKPNISRKELRAFRALLHNVEKNGLQEENRYQHHDFWGYIRGYANYISMVRPDLSQKLAEQVQRIGQKHGLVSLANY